MISPKRKKVTAETMYRRYLQQNDEYYKHYQMTEIDFIRESDAKFKQLPDSQKHLFELKAKKENAMRLKTSDYSYQSDTLGYKIKNVVESEENIKKWRRTMLARILAFCNSALPGTSHSSSSASNSVLNREFYALRIGGVLYAKSSCITENTFAPCELAFVRFSYSQGIIETMTLFPQQRIMEPGLKATFYESFEEAMGYKPDLFNDDLSFHHTYTKMFEFFRGNFNRPLFIPTEKHLINEVVPSLLYLFEQFSIPCYWIECATDWAKNCNLMQLEYLIAVLEQIAETEQEKTKAGEADENGQQDGKQEDQEHQERRRHAGDQNDVIEMESSPDKSDLFASTSSAVQEHHSSKRMKQENSTAATSTSYSFANNFKLSTFINPAKEQILYRATAKVLQAWTQLPLHLQHEMLCLRHQNVTSSAAICATNQLRMELHSAFVHLEQYEVVPEAYLRYLERQNEIEEERQHSSGGEEWDDDDDNLRHHQQRQQNNCNQQSGNGRAGKSNSLFVYGLGFDQIAKSVPGTMRGGPPHRNAFGQPIGGAASSEDSKGVWEAVLKSETLSSSTAADAARNGEFVADGEADDGELGEQGEGEWSGATQMDEEAYARLLHGPRYSLEEEARLGGGGAGGERRPNLMMGRGLGLMHRRQDQSAPGSMQVSSYSSANRNRPKLPYVEL